MSNQVLRMATNYGRQLQHYDDVVPDLSLRCWRGKLDPLAFLETTLDRLQPDIEVLGSRCSVPVNNVRAFSGDLYPSRWQLLCASSKFEVTSTIVS